MTLILFALVILLAWAVWYGHTKHADALELLRGDIAWMRAAIVDLKRKPPQ